MIQPQTRKTKRDAIPEDASSTECSLNRVPRAHPPQSIVLIELIKVRPGQAIVLYTDCIFDLQSQFHAIHAVLGQGYQRSQTHAEGCVVSTIIARTSSVCSIALIAIFIRRAKHDSVPCIYTPLIKAPDASVYCTWGCLSSFLVVAESTSAAEF